jgi:hypothetical protein
MEALTSAIGTILATNGVEAYSFMTAEAKEVLTGGIAFVAKEVSPKRFRESSGSVATTSPQDNIPAI